MTSLTDITLFLDTTSSRLMLGLSINGQMITRRVMPCDSHRYHSALLIPAIQEMLTEQGLKIRQLSALAVNLGPGSFTGIRTGIITARTLGQFLEIPVYGLNQFELLTAGQEKLISVFLDALRGRAYHAQLQFNEQGPVYQEPPSLKNLDSSEPCYFNLDAADTHYFISPTLKHLFQPIEDQQRKINQKASVDCISEDFFSPDAMLKLITAYPKIFVKSWQHIRPFYLQEPSITLAKKNISTIQGNQSK